MIKHYFSLAIVLVLCCMFIGCNANSDFQYVETTVLDSATKDPEPWRNNTEFSYTASPDQTENVINFRNGWQTSMYTAHGKLYFSRTDMPVQYDAATNRQTTLCTDPLCTHYTAECPFAYANIDDGFYVVDDKVLYYGYDAKNRQHNVKLYSMTDRTTKVLRVREGNQYAPAMIALKDSYYFIDMVYDKDSESYSYSLCRQMYESGDIEVLRTDTDYNVTLMGADEDVVYLYDDIECALIAYASDGKTELYRTSVESGQMSIHKDGYLIIRTADGELIRMNLDGSNRQSLGITGVDYFYLTDSYIYYRTVQDKIDGVEYYDGEYIDASVDLQAVYRTDHEGNSKELVWENRDETSILELEDFIVSGNYLYANFTHCSVDGDQLTFTFNSQGSMPYSYTYSRIDCSVGEIYYIKVE